MHTKTGPYGCVHFSTSAFCCEMHYTVYSKPKLNIKKIINLKNKVRIQVIESCETRDESQGKQGSGHKLYLVTK